MRNFVFLVFFISFLSNGQVNSEFIIDSLEKKLPKIKTEKEKIDILNQIAYEYKFIDPKKNLDNATKALEFAKKTNYLDGIINAKRNLGYFYLITSDYKQAQDNFNFIIKNSKDNAKIGVSYSGLGVIEAKQSNYPEALKLYFKGLKFAENSNDKIIQAKILSNIGSVYYDTNEFNKSIQFQKKALAIPGKNGFKEDDNLRLHNIGLCYFELKNYDKCLKFIQKAELLDDKLGNLMNKISCIGVRGRVYFERKEYDKALSIFLKQLELNNEFGDPHNISGSYSRIGDVYQIKAITNSDLSKRKAFYLKALEYYTKSIALNKENNDLQNLSMDYSSIYELEKNQNNFKEALSALELSKAYNDSVFNQDNKETIKNIEDKRTIEVKEKQLKINQLELQAKEKQKWFYIFGIGLFAIIGGLLFYQSRNRKKTNEKLQQLNIELDQANKTKTRFFSILNHDLRGPVANLIHFLHLQKDNPELLDEETKNRMQNKTISGAENLLSSMEDILLWSKGQMENFKPQAKMFEVNDLFEDTKKVFSGYHKIKFEYHNFDAISIFTDENYLKTIVRNLTSNAINVFSTTQNPTIIWKAWKENGISYLSITDNGPGANSDQFKALYDDKEVVGIKSGLGLHLIRDLAKAIDCEISVDSSIGQGTTFVLKF
ncbi:MAG: tetratricopeptide repeat-containing sensor histidine kinase [Flavobacterium sp.]|uniref:ATP-binding protein n=1 Tax=Flavobacterium sp. TaxID=239 RepID=UPI0022C2AC46|nr:tetratricopeptide repeat-containing sensor histidine kinase [Flavobacterium sp.]MCZ8197790.1 tetratricopeptide repeat-containing sensor histidine kinase [Flavobacterium sp.]